MNIETKSNRADTSVLPAAIGMDRRRPAQLLVERGRRMRSHIRLALGLCLGVALVAMMFE
jgi:hypothetical protein